MKNIRKILIGLIILNIILLILQICNYMVNNKEPEVQLRSEPKAIQEDNKLYPANSFKFTYLYDGELEIEIFYRRIYKFVNYLEKLYTDTKNLEESDLSTYYKNNTKQIKEITGITSKEQFTKLVEQVKKCNVDEKYDKVEMENDTYKNNNSDCSIQINITYKNKESVKVVAIFSKDNSADNLVKFLPVEKE